jgi:hypothetical protein
MSVSHVPQRRGGPPARAPRGPGETTPAPQSPATPPQAADYGPRLRQAEQVISAADWQASENREGGRPHVPRAGAEEPSGGALFPSDPRAVFVLLNEGRYLAIQGLFGVSRNQVNVMTVIAALMLAEAAHAKTERLRGRLGGATRSDVLLADGLLNALGQGIAGPFAREIPFVAPLIGVAVAGVVARRVVQNSSRNIKAASARITVSLRHLNWG